MQLQHRLAISAASFLNFTVRKQRLMVHRVLRRIFEPKGYEVTVEWRKLHNEELHDMYFSAHFILMTHQEAERLWWGDPRETATW